MPDKQGKKDVFDVLKPFTSKLKPAIDWFRTSKFNFVLVILVIVVLVLLFRLFQDMLKSILIISFLIFLGGISKIYQRYLKGVQIGIEFIMLATVLSGYVYGPFVGGVVGFFTFSLATYFSGRFSHTLVISFILITVVGIVSPLFRDASITTAGIILTLIYDIILFFVYLGWFRGRIPRITLFVITHFVWNLWVFTSIAPFMLNLLK